MDPEAPACLTGKLLYLILLNTLFLLASGWWSDPPWIALVALFALAIYASKGDYKVTKFMILFVILPAVAGEAVALLIGRLVTEGVVRVGLLHFLGLLLAFLVASRHLLINGWLLVATAMNMRLSALSVTLFTSGVAYLFLLATALLAPFTLALLSRYHPIVDQVLVGAFFTHVFALAGVAKLGIAAASLAVGGREEKEWGVIILTGTALAFALALQSLTVTLAASRGYEDLNVTEYLFTQRVPLALMWLFAIGGLVTWLLPSKCEAAQPIIVERVGVINEVQRKRRSLEEIFVGEKVYSGRRCRRHWLDLLPCLLDPGDCEGYRDPDCKR